MRALLKTLFTWQNIMAVVTGIVLIAGWKQNQDIFRELTEQRIARLETQLNQATAENAENKLSRALMAASLAQIQVDIASMRAEVKEVRTEVRKIR